MTDERSDSGVRMNVATSRGQRIVPALVVIALGAIFLCGNLGVHIPFFDWANWWAWFILVGAAWPLAEAWTRYRAVGAVDDVVARSLLSALAIAMVAAIFILGLDWAVWWPLFLIYGGVYMLLRDPRHRRRDRSN